MPVVRRAVLTVPAMPPVGVPSGMRSSGLRGGAGGGVAASRRAAFAVACWSVPIGRCAPMSAARGRAPRRRGRAVAGAGQRERRRQRAGIAPGTAGLRASRRPGDAAACWSRRSPVRPAPEPGGLPKLGGWLRLRIVEIRQRAGGRARLGAALWRRGASRLRRTSSLVVIFEGRAQAVDGRGRRLRERMRPRARRGAQPRRPASQDLSSHHAARATSSRRAERGLWLTDVKPGWLTPR